MWFSFLAWQISFWGISLLVLISLMIFVCKRCFITWRIPRGWRGKWRKKKSQIGASSKDPRTRCLCFHPYPFANLFFLGATAVMFLDAWDFYLCYNLDECWKFVWYKGEGEFASEKTHSKWSYKILKETIMIIYNVIYIQSSFPQIPFIH